MGVALELAGVASWVVGAGVGGDGAAMACEVVAAGDWVGDELEVGAPGRARKVARTAWTASGHSWRWLPPEMAVTGLLFK